MKYETDKQYCLISLLTDGYVSPVAYTKQGLCDHLNNDDFGYRPLTKEELHKMIDSLQQGFY